MARPSLDEIYSRLRQVPGYHPMSASTYADWSMEAGDSIEIERDGTVYRVPVGKTTVRWNGSHRVDVRTEGNKERESVSRVSVDKYTGAGAGGGGGSAGIRNSGEIHNYVEDLEGKTWTRFDQTDKAISMEAEARTEQGRYLGGRIDVEAGRISAVVTENGQIRAGMIVDAINKDSSVRIMADKILLSGDTTINDIFRVSSVGVFVSRPMLVGASALTSVYMGENRVVAGSIQVRGRGGSTRALNVADVTVNGNILTITYANGTTQNFSKATSLTGAWSGSVCTGKAYKVEARQPGDSSPVAVHTSPVVSRVDTDYYYTESGTPMLRVTVKDANSTDVLSTGVDATDAYNAGSGSVTPEAHTWRGYFDCEKKSSGGVWTVTLKRTWSSGAPPSVFVDGGGVNVYTT